jgi:hypothetical protein
MTDQKIKQNEFLRKLYEKGIFYPPGIYFDEISKELEIDKSFTINEILPYLKYKGWIKPVTTGGNYIITIWGIDEVRIQLSSHAEVRDIIYKTNQFLRRLKEIKDETGQDKDMYELGKELDFDTELTSFLVYYLRGKRVVELPSLGSVIRSCLYNICGYMVVNDSSPGARMLSTFFCNSKLAPYSPASVSSHNLLSFDSN